MKYFKNSMSFNPPVRGQTDIFIYYLLRLEITDFAMNMATHPTKIQNMALSNELSERESAEDNGIMRTYAIKINRIAKASIVRWLRIIPAARAMGSSSRFLWVAYIISSAISVPEKSVIRYVVVINYFFFNLLLALFLLSPASV